MSSEAGMDGRQDQADAEDYVFVDRRPRLLRWLLPMACADSRPLDGRECARLHLIAYH